MKKQINLKQKIGIFDAIKSRRVNLRIIPIETIYSTVLTFLWNFFFYSFFFLTVIAPQFENQKSEAYMWYAIIPMTIEIGLILFMYSWHRIGLRRLGTSFPDSWFYAFIGSLIYCLSYSVLFYFYKCYRFSIIYLFAPIIVSVMHNSKKWIVSTAVLSASFSGLFSSDILDVPKWQYIDIPNWANSLYAIETTAYLAIITVLLFMIRQAADSANEAKVAKEQAKSAFLANMSHELRTPLNAVVGFNQMILDASHEKEVLAYAEKIRESGNKLTSILDSVFDYSEKEIAGSIVASTNEDNKITDEMIHNFTAEGAHILAVDDVSINLTIFKGLLKETKLNIDTAMNAEEAISLVKDNHYDMIFMDYMMPVIDGLEALKQMKQGGYVSDFTPVVVFTANAVSDSNEKYVALGFSDFLAKPLTEKSLKSMLIKYLPDNLKKYE